MGRCGRGVSEPRSALHELMSRNTFFTDAPRGVLTAILACLLGGAADGSDISPADTFRSSSAALAAKAGSAMTVTGGEGWLFLANELRHAGAGPFWGPEAAKASRAAKPGEADPLPAILDFKRQLDALGIGLILVPVPPKAAVYPDKAMALPGWAPPVRVDAALVAWYDLLRGKGIEVLDLTEVFLEARGTGRAPYCRQDSHWSGAGCELAARQLAGLIRSQPWYGGVPRQEYRTQQSMVTLSGDLWGSIAEDARPEREEVSLRAVSGTDGRPVPPDRASPVVLMGDSHNLVFHSGGDMHAAGAGLPDQLAFELGFAVDLVAVRGSGATPARVNLYRNGRAHPSYLAGKKLVIWCFTAREFTESQGWRLVPVSR